MKTSIALFVCLFMISSFSHSESQSQTVAINDAALTVSEKWSLKRHDETGAAFLTRSDNQAQLVVFAKYVPGGTQDLSLFLETYEARGLPISSVQVGDFSGYFIPFELEDGCHANWILLNGDHFLSAGYLGDCDTVDYAPVIEMIKSIQVASH